MSSAVRPRPAPSEELPNSSMTDRKRAALFVGHQRGDEHSAGELLTCTRHAKAANHRVVAMVGDGSECRRSGLSDLIARMAEGEFDVILAMTAAGSVVAINSALGLPGLTEISQSITLTDGLACAQSRTAAVRTPVSTVPCAGLYDQRIGRGTNGNENHGY